MGEINPLVVYQLTTTGRNCDKTKVLKHSMGSFGERTEVAAELPFSDLTQPSLTSEDPTEYCRAMELTLGKTKVFNSFL